ncbi:EamA family transporter [Comamonas sp. NLF-1-9]|uniref:EamA family transporter n=1 Tax=Comamonas sp. NLF-1-9 TaxID=2853163 RepID=UPI001C456FCA|nr:EamA family transporter [Comamonas sp. NLF-1-9]QXL83761.1 EamA family transporter [Comamonas sp. NLF-1-9]
MATSPASSRGLVLVLLAAMLWGSTGTAQALAPSGLSSYWVGALRVALAAGFFVLLALRAPLRRGPWPWPRLLLAAGCIAAYNLSFFAGVRASGVALGTAIAVGSAPIWAGLIQTLVQGRLPPPLWWLGTLVSVASGALMTLAQGEQLQLTPAGVALCLTAGLSYASYTLLNKGLVLHLGAAWTNLGVFGLAGLLSVPAAWWLSGPLPALGGSWGVVLFLGLVSTGLAYLLFSSGLRHISGATGVTLALAEPVTAFVLAVLVVGEFQPLAAWLGLAGVVAGLLMVVRAELRAGAAQ